MSYYKDLRDYLETLETHGLLIRIRRQIDKDTQLHPLARLQFRGLSEEQRKAFLFENVVDRKGRNYGIPVLVCALAASRVIYAMGMQCRPEEIMEKWARAQLSPIEPKIVENGPIHEEVHVGNTLLEHGGLEEFPIPVSTPGYDVAPYITAPCWVTKDPESGIANVGTYRAHVKSPTRVSMMVASQDKDIAKHWNKCRKLGIPLQAAIVVGASPNIGYTSVARLPYELSEFACAGGIAGEPVELVKCKTVDLEVPATSEVVVEGELSTHEVEPEGPFGEFDGYMGQRENMPYFTVKCITHRKNPIWHAFLSQFPPSESSKLRGTAWENRVYKYIKYDLNVPQIKAVAWHESTGSGGFVVLQFENPEQSEVSRILEHMSTWLPTEVYHSTKFIVAVDDDINPWDADAVNWAISFRVQPHRDCHITTFSAKSLMDYSVAPPGEAEKRDIRYERMPDASNLTINATRKWSYPPVSLPRKEFMEEAIKIWKQENLPELRLKEPWYGYNLGFWPDDYEEEVELALKGEYEKVGEILASKRRKL